MTAVVQVNRRPDLPPHIASGENVTETLRGFSWDRAAARRSKPLAKRALHSAVASERLAVIWAKTFVGIRTSEIGRGSIVGVTSAANQLTG